MKFVIGLITAIGLFVDTMEVYAQMPDENINKINQEEVIDAVGRLLQERYLYLDSAEKMNVFLHEAIKSGTYSNATSARGFARMITNDLLNNFHDKHIRLIYAPKLAKSLGTNSSNEPSQEEIENELKVEIFENYRLPELRRLEGNIGYLKIDQFLPPKYARGYSEKMAACFEFIGNTNGLIIDLRDNPGGYGDGVGFFLSYLLPPKTKIIEEKYRIPNGGLGQELGFTGTIVEGKPYLDRPIYVLISAQTASAAEAVAHVLKYSKRALLVGHTSFGAGYLGDDFPVDENFVLTVSYASQKHPDAPRNWEGIGLTPDINASYEEALLIAHTQLLGDLIKLENDKPKKDRDQDRLKQIEWTFQKLKDLQNPIQLDKSILTTYLGQYENRSVILDDEDLIYQKAGGPKINLIPVGTDEFLSDKLNYRFKFDRDKTTNQISSLSMSTTDRLFRYQKTN